MTDKTTMEEYSDEKRFASALGVVLMLAGAIVGGFGVFNFILTMIDMTSIPFGPSFDYSEIGTLIGSLTTQSLVGMGLIGGGAAMFIIGLYLVQIANIKRISSYLASETSPAFGTMSEAGARGFNRGGGLRISGIPSSRETIKIRCRACNTLNSETAKHCQECGRKL